MSRFGNFTRIFGENICQGLCDDTDYGNNLGRRVFDFISLIDREKEALVDTHTRETLKFGYICDRSKLLAITLSKIGLEMDDYLAVISENNVENAVPLAASLFLGVTFHPINPNYSDAEIKRHLSLTKPKAIFCSGDLLDRINSIYVTVDFRCHPPYAYGTPRYEALMDVNKFELLKLKPENYERDHVSVVIATAGIVSLPKLAMIKSESLLLQMIYMARPNLGRIPGITDVIINMFPIYTIMGFIIQLGNLFHRFKSILTKEITPGEYFGYMKQFNCTTLIITSDVADFLALPCNEEKYFKNIHGVLVLGSLRNRTKHSIQLKANSPSTKYCISAFDNEHMRICRVRPLYGLVETSGPVLIQPYGGVNPVHEGCSGILFPNMAGKICNVLTGDLLSSESEGEFRFKGPLLMKGYVGDPVATQAAFDQQGFFRSGDYGVTDFDEYFYHKDKIQDVIIFRGKVHSPSLLESYFEEIRYVKECAVLAMHEASLEHSIFVFIVVEQGRFVTEEEIRRYFRVFIECRTDKEEDKNLEPKYPPITGCKFIDEIPKSRCGVKLRQKLRAIFKA